MKTAMRNLSERLEKTIKYYNDTHGVASSYHFKMVKKLVDEEYLLQEKQQIIDAVIETSMHGETMANEQAQRYYDSNFGDKVEEAGI